MGKPTEGYFLNKDVDVDLNRTTLPAPALNIEGFYFQDHGEEGLFGYNWKDLETGDYPFQNLDKQMYVYNGKRYSLADIQSLGDCKPKSSQVRVHRPPNAELVLPN